MSVGPSVVEAVVGGIMPVRKADHVFDTGHMDGHKTERAGLAGGNKCRAV